MVKFIHTGDWQLGMTRHFLAGGAPVRFAEARLDSVRTIARLAHDEHCDFVVVCGDVFESNQVDRRVVARALDALKSFDVPVYLLPGNHDPINAASVYRSATFIAHCPPNVTVLDEAGARTVPGREVELVSAPWFSKAPLKDLAAEACADLARDGLVLRVLVAHGMVNTLSPDPDNPSLIRLATVEQAVGSGQVHYVALGDRHSLGEVGRTGRIWYAGSPLATDYGEVEPNHVLLVTLERGSVNVDRRRTGSWQFLRQSFDVNNRSEVDAVQEWLAAVPDNRFTVLKLSFVGTLNLADKAHLDEILEHHSDLFAALETWERQTELVVRPDDRDLRNLGLVGFGADAMDELCAMAALSGPGAEVAQDALSLLYRLVGRPT
jgi:DNA repair exonuclease SbcCD nuclease subunit